jgi:hypothetical protein
LKLLEDNFPAEFHQMAANFCFMRKVMPHLC